MRQAGILAAAAIVALDEGFSRLHEDHVRAKRLASKLADVQGLCVRENWTQTNMVWLDFEKDQGEAWVAHCKDHGILVSASNYGARLVTHVDVTDEDVEKAVTVIEKFFMTPEK